MCCAIQLTIVAFYNQINEITTFHVLEILLIKPRLSFKYFDFSIYHGQNINLQKWKGYYTVKKIESHFTIEAPLHLGVGDLKVKKVEVSVAQSCLSICDPVDCSPPGSSVHGDSPGKNTGVGCHALPQGIFPTQGQNPGLLHCRQILYCLIQSRRWNHMSPQRFHCTLEFIISKGIINAYFYRIGTESKLKINQFSWIA